MLTKEQAWELFQDKYFDLVDSGEMEKAASIFHDDVEWIHTQVWEHDEHRRDKGSDRLKGKKQVEALLKGRTQSMGKESVRHVLQEMVFDGKKGAFIAHVKGADKEVPLFAWFELRDEKVYRYIVGPLYLT